MTKKTIATSPRELSQHVDLTAGEMEAREVEEAALLAALPIKRWMAEMEESDTILPRYVEDIIDALPQAQRDSIAAETLSKYNDKKTKRAQKPA